MSLLLPPLTLLPFGSAESASRDEPSAATVLAVGEDARSHVAATSLRELALFRSIAVAGQALAIVVALMLGIALPLAAMTLVVVALLAGNAVSWQRALTRGHVSDRELFATLVFDIACFTALLVAAGGAGNPFVLFYILHVALVALLLPARWAVAGVATVIAAAGVALALGLPLRMEDGRPVPTGVLAAGRALCFLLVVAMVAWFIARATSVLRAQERMLVDAARRMVNDETMVRIAALAAGAAHELGTPLMTMNVLVDEWRRRELPPDLARDATLLAAQIAACRGALGSLRAAAGQARIGPVESQPLDRFLEGVAERCRLLRPDVHLRTDCSGSHPPPHIVAEPAVAQAILILLNNAADASATDVRMLARWTPEALELEIADRGPGIPQGMLNKLGRTFFTTKPAGRGTGLGLMLTTSTLDRLGGTIRWSHREGGGTRVEVKLPLSPLHPSSHPENYDHV